MTKPPPSIDFARVGPQTPRHFTLRTETVVTSNLF